SRSAAETAGLELAPAALQLVGDSRLAPILYRQPAYPGEVFDVPGDQAEPVLLGGGCDDEIGVPLGLARPVGLRPELGGAIEHRVGDRQDKRMLAERGEALELARRALRLQSSNDFVAGKCGKRETLVRLQIRGGLLDNNRVLLFEDLRKQVRVEQAGHCFTRRDGSDRPAARSPFQARRS